LTPADVPVPPALRARGAAKRSKPFSITGDSIFLDLIAKHLSPIPPPAPTSRCYRRLGRTHAPDDSWKTFCVSAAVTWLAPHLRQAKLGTINAMTQSDVPRRAKSAFCYDGLHRALSITTCRYESGFVRVGVDPRHSGHGPCGLRVDAPGPRRPTRSAYAN